MRVKSEGNVYHAIARGVGQQIIFEDEQDFKRFLEIVGRLRAEHGCEVLAWCLMDNHVHLLLRVDIESLSDFMQALQIAYAKYFNKKYDRVGHLFSGRFSSEAVDSDEYLMTVVRYIHRNPVNERIVTSCDGYRWSSYNSYFKHPEAPGRPFVIAVFGGLKEFEDFHDIENDDECEIEKKAGAMGVMRPSDNEALVLAQNIIGEVSLFDLKSMGKGNRDAYLVKMKAGGLSIRQIARLTGIGRGVVARAGM